MQSEPRSVKMLMMMLRSKEEDEKVEGAFVDEIEINWMIDGGGDCSSH
jgi:hypothetical protein